MMPERKCQVLNYTPVLTQMDCRAGQLVHLPEYEKEHLAGEVFSFFPRQPEELARSSPYQTDYSDGKKIIRPQLERPERVAEILSMTTAMLENTADFDRNYQGMQKAFSDLTAYQNGTFLLFTPANKSTAKTSLQSSKSKTVAPPTAEPSTVTAAEYDLQLGATVYLGIEEFELNTIDDAHVVLRDMSAPLFTLDMPRDIFERRLRENRLNGELINTTAAPEPEKPIVIEETPRVLYKKYLPILVEEIKNGELYDFLRDEDTDTLAAETEIGKNLDSLSESTGEDDPAFYSAYNDIPQFREWLIEDIYKRTYELEVTYERDYVARSETSTNAPEWSKRPEVQEQIREELSLRDFAVSDELIADGIADYIENEYLADEPSPKETLEAEPTPYTPKRGDRYEIQGRLFVVDKVDTDWETVSLRDITFENGTGFPIFRSESLEFIRMYEPIQPEPFVPKQDIEPISGLKSIVIDLTARDRCGIAFAPSLGIKPRATSTATSTRSRRS